jgi:hypothetical protein
MKVCRLNGTNQLGRPDRTWLAQWELSSGQSAFLCAVKDCIMMPCVGGLVQRDVGDASWYIVPLCAACNRRTNQDLEIWDLAKLVAVIDAKLEHLVFPRRTASARRLIFATP